MLAMESPASASHLLDTLCDVVPNPHRTSRDIQTLLENIERSPKDYVPFKGKIIMHLNLHAHFNPRINPKLIAASYSKATLLFRKGVNKDEGPLGCWKDAFRREITILEDNLDQLYQLVGVSTNRIVGDSMMANAEEVQSKEILNEGRVNDDYKTTIDSYVSEVNMASLKICALISTKTDFDLPVPPLILLRFAFKICLLRKRDYRKSINSLVKEYVYAKVEDLVNISIHIIRVTVSVLGTNVIPFLQLANRAILGLLEWTRASNLLTHDPDKYHSIRFKLFGLLNFVMDKLALHINLDSQQIQTLLDTEVVDNLEHLGNVEGTAKEEHLLETLRFAEKFYLQYSAYLNETLEKRVKSYIIHECLNIYREFKANKTPENYRYQLLHLLQVIANQPHANSTTEISHNIFELAERLEPSARIKSLARRCILVGLAHRPTIVSRESVLELEPDMFSDQPAAVIEPEQREQLQQPSPLSPSLPPPSLAQLSTCPPPLPISLPAQTLPLAPASPVALAPQATAASPTAQAPLPTLESPQVPSAPTSLPPPPTASPPPPSSPPSPEAGETRLALSPSLFHGLN